jgi:hypothetical protein
MNHRVRPSPWLSLAWEPAVDGCWCLTLRAPPNTGSHRLATHELWVVELLDHLGATDGAWTLAELVTLARGHATADADIEATLTELWPLAFVDAQATEWHDAALAWEQHGWKFALQYMLASVAEPAPRQVTAPPPKKPISTQPRPLPAPLELPELALEATLHRRRTCREFAGTPLEIGTLATLLARATRCARLPPQLAVHLVVMRVAGLEPGVYRHLPDEHAIVPLHHASTEQLEAQLVRTLIGQPYVIGTAVAVLMSGQLDALITERPADSTLRAWLIEVGMLGQRLLLAGHALQIDSFLSAAILEHEARALTVGDIDASMSPIHLVAFGGR